MSQPDYDPLEALLDRVTNARGYLFSRTLADGRVLDVQLLITGTAQLQVSRDAAAVGWDDGF